jgi:Uma2 family endonuclease
MSVLSKKLFNDDVLDEKFVLENIDSLPTEDDLPYDDGEPMETIRHRIQMNVLIESLEEYWSKSKSYFVGGNMFLYYDPYNKNKFVGPDFFLVLYAEDRERKSWLVWQEGMKYPDVIIELLSDSTRRIDYNNKKDLYEQVFKTREYYLYDPESQEFMGFHLLVDHYKPILPDTENRIYSPTTDLYLIIKDNWLRWMTKEGSILPTGKELAKRERERAEKEREKAEKERERAEKEREKAEKEREKAEKESKRAEKESKRAEHAEEKFKHMEQLLKKYQQRFGNLIDEEQ